MRPAFLVTPLIFAALIAIASAQSGAASKPEGKPGALEKSPAASEPKGALSELSNSGSAQKFATLPSRYIFLLSESMRRFQLRDFKGALDYVARADEVLPPTAWSLNIRGAAAIEQRDFENGYKQCSDALKLDPAFFPAKFNICEIPFLQGKYAEARGLWVKLLATVKGGDSTEELVIYRVFLTYLLENDFDHAKEWMGKIPFPSQTPAYQYANAAWARQKGDIGKWDEWLRSAAYIWPESKRSEYADVLIQIGWLKRE